jgi:coatomer protein complex subunit alpha (xenin)
LAAVFTARAKFAVLDKTRSIILRSSASDPGKKLKPPYANADFLFPAATAGRVLVRADDKICLFELQSRRVVAEISSILVKYVVWSADGSYVALIGKHCKFQWIFLVLSSVQIMSCVCCSYCVG